MSFTDIKSALKYINKQVEQGPVGDGEIDFINMIFKRMSVAPSPKQLEWVRAAVDDGERRGMLHVTRDSTGRVICVDKFDCGRAVISAPATTLPALSSSALLPVMHGMLESRAKNGLVVTGQTTELLVEELFTELSKAYRLDRHQVSSVFSAMHQLGLRGDSAKLRRSGMEVSPDRGYEAFVSNQSPESKKTIADLTERLDGCVISVNL